MVQHVLDCRIFFGDDGNALNAYNHLKALAEHGAAHDQQVGTRVETSWARLHECFSDEDQGDTGRCATVALFKLGDAGLEEPGESGGELPLWEQPQPGVPHPDHPYLRGAEVMHNGKAWRSTHEGENVWQPGQFGWVEIR